MELTHRWLPRNVSRFRELHPDGPSSGLLFGICQGGFDVDRRRMSAEVTAAAEVDGLAIGGLSVGEPKDVMATMLDASLEPLALDRPRYLMGVGSPEDLWNGVAAGVDMFDCVLPTRVARRGALYTPDGRVDVTGARFKTVDEPIDSACDCPTCRTFSAAYLHHLFRAGELLAYRLGSMHNVRFLHRQMEAMRVAIEEGRFQQALEEFGSRYQPADQRVAAQQRERYRSAQKRRRVPSGSN